MVSALWTFMVHVTTTMPAHPNKHRKRAIELMEAGLATPGEISRALSLDPSLVRSWRRRAGINTETAPSDFFAWRVWITSIASIVAKLWSRMLREREIRRLRAAWETVDDRTLKDIGISRYEIEYGRDPRHGS